MSDATRAVALAQAVTVVAMSPGNKDAAEVLAVALSFDNFLNSVGETEAPKASTPGKEPTKKTTAGQSASKKTATTARTEEEIVDKALAAETTKTETASDEQTLTTDDVQAVIAKALAANKRKEILAVLKKYGAASASGVKGANIAKFVAEATKLLPSDEDDGGDLTA